MICFFKATVHVLSMLSNFFYHEVIFNNGNNYHDDGEDFENDHYKDA